MNECICIDYTKSGKFEVILRLEEEEIENPSEFWDFYSGLTKFDLFTSNYTGKIRDEHIKILINNNCNTLTYLAFSYINYMFLESYKHAFRVCKILKYIKLARLKEAQLVELFTIPNNIQRIAMKQCNRMSCVFISQLLILSPSINRLFCRLTSKTTEEEKNDLIAQYPNVDFVF
jgi:hypothetical protein